VDQAFQEVALQGLPVRFCMDRAGLVGGDGAVHHGFMDIAMLRSLPGMTLLAAMDEANLKAALEFMRTHDAGPSALRYPRDEVPEPALADEVPPFEPGRAHLLAEGSDAAILAYGFPANHALVAREQLKARGYTVAVYDARFAKPVDVELIRQLVALGIPILTVEDHAVLGGFGSCVLEACNEHGLATQNIHRLGLPDEWIYQGGRGEQQRLAGIDAEGIARKVVEVLEAAPRSKTASISERRKTGRLERKLGA
jgi:1-deoxy-D-xylulose-5-phosphate synthase